METVMERIKQDSREYNEFIAMLNGIFGMDEIVKKLTGKASLELYMKVFLGRQ